MPDRDALSYMPTLETPRLELRKLTLRDAQDNFVRLSCSASTQMM